MAAISPTCSYSTTGTLAAGVAIDVDIPIDGAVDWQIVLVNTGGSNAITALSIKTSPKGTLFSAATSIATGIPLAAGASLDAIRGTGEPCTTVRLTITSASGTTYALEALGY